MTTPSREKPEIIAGELRAMIVSGEVAEGDSLGREPDLVEQFGVSRPSLREALRILLFAAVAAAVEMAAAQRGTGDMDGTGRRETGAGTAAATAATNAAASGFDRAAAERDLASG